MEQSLPIGAKGSIAPAKDYSEKAPYPSGLRGRSAKPFFSGSNPLGASKDSNPVNAINR